MSTLTASEQIQQLERRIVELRAQALVELKEKLAQARLDVVALEKHLAELTGQPVQQGVAIVPAVRQVRRAALSDEELKPQILRAMAERGQRGLNAKDIATFIGIDPMRVRRFINANPNILKRQGSGPGTKFFLP